MNNQVTVIPEASKNSIVSVQEMKAQINAIQQILKDVMKEGVHYGKIAGCGDKLVLLKPGAEKILATFRIAIESIHVEDLSDDDCIRYRVITTGVTPFGLSMGSGIGECSTDEEKYKWRAVICDEEFEETPDDKRRIKFKKSREKINGRYQNIISKIKQIRTSPADLANTVLKMAKKRALVDFCLTATACSDVFDQDLEEMPEQLRKQLTESQQISPTQRKQKRETSIIQFYGFEVAESSNGSSYMKIDAKGGLTYYCSNQDLFELIQKSSKEGLEIEYYKNSQGQLVVDSAGAVENA